MKKNDEYKISHPDIYYQIILSVFYISIISIWSLSIAFNQAPDESTHFFLLEFLKKFHTLPLASDPHEPLVGIVSGYTWQKGSFWYHGLPFPHILGALLTAQIGSWLLPVENLYIGARSFNWFLGCIFICALFRTSRSIGLPLITSALIAGTISLIPQVTFVFSYLNSDAYGLASVALLISTLTSFINSPTKKRAFYLGLSIGLVLMAKIYFAPALIFAFATLVINFFFKNKKIFKHVHITIVAIIITSAPMLTTVYLNYGEVSGVSGQMDFVNLHKSNPAVRYGTCYLLCNDNVINKETIFPWLDLTFKSYFSVTGWMNIYISNLIYKIAAIYFILLIIFAIYQARSINKYELKSNNAIYYSIPVIMVICLYPSIIILSLIASQNSLPQPQGRYLFVTIPFLALLLSLVAHRLINREEINSSKLKNERNQKN